MHKGRQKHIKEIKNTNSIVRRNNRQEPDIKLCSNLVLLTYCANVVHLKQTTSSVYYVIVTYYSENINSKTEDGICKILQNHFFGERFFEVPYFVRKIVTVGYAV